PLSFSHQLGEIERKGLVEQFGMILIPHWRRGIESVQNILNLGGGRGKKSLAEALPQLMGVHGVKLHFTNLATCIRPEFLSLAYRQVKIGPGIGGLRQLGQRSSRGSD